MTVVAIVPPPHKVCIRSRSVVGSVGVAELAMSDSETSIQNVGVNARSILYVWKVVGIITLIVAVIYAVEVPIRRRFRFIDSDLAVFLNLIHFRIVTQCYRRGFREVNRKSFECMLIDVSYRTSVCRQQLVSHWLNFIESSFTFEDHDVLVANRLV